MPFLGAAAGDASLGALLGTQALGSGLGALGQVMLGDDQDAQSFRDVFPAGSMQDNLVDPAQLLYFTNQGASRLGQSLTEIAEQPFQFGPAAMVQTPGFYHGGDLPFPIGMTGGDPGFLPTAGKNLRDPFNSFGDSGGGGTGEPPGAPGGGGGGGPAFNPGGGGIGGPTTGGNPMQQQASGQRDLTNLMMALRTLGGGG